MELDANFQTVKVLRPFTGFEPIYQGERSTTPILFTPSGIDSPTGPSGGAPLDSQAGQQGYSPNLVRGLSVPMGSRLNIWLPVLVASTFPVLAEDAYIFAFVWRMRNLFDYRNKVGPYHFPKSDNGITDNSVAPAAPRVIIPAASHAIVYNQSEPALPLFTVGSRAVQHNWPEDMQPYGEVSLPLPLLPNGANGYYQQGLYDPNSSPLVAGSPFYNVYDIMAFGDELIIACYRQGAVNANFTNWNFSSGVQVDANFSLFFGANAGNLISAVGPFPSIGVYVTPGVAP